MLASASGMWWASGALPPPPLTSRVVRPYMNQRRSRERGRGVRRDAGTARGGRGGEGGWEGANISGPFTEN